MAGGGTGGNLAGSIDDPAHIGAAGIDCHAGFGVIAVRPLSPQVAEADTVGILSYQAVFFATSEREIVFRKWMASDRPDILQPANSLPDQPGGHTPAPLPATETRIVA